MKRHESLIPLSRFHRSCLFLALIAEKNPTAVKGYPTEIEEKIAYANGFFRRQLQPHFGQETKLWSCVRNKSEKLSAIINELEIERKYLIHLFESIGKTADYSSFHVMGNLLKKHVRKEERVLFKQIQEDLSEEELLHISSIL